MDKPTKTNFGLLATFVSLVCIAIILATLILVFFPFERALEIIGGAFQMSEKASPKE